MNIERKLIQRLKKLKRLEMKQIFRSEDITTAYYCEETDELIIFIDVVLDDCKTHFQAWGILKDKKIWRFAAGFISRTVIHELLHWCGITSSRMCEYVALLFTWDEGTAKIVSGWLYPTQKLVDIPVIEK